MKRILVVDDDPLVCKLVLTGLQEAGFAVKVVHNGKDALDKVRLFSFDMIVLDIVMPKMDGFQFLRELRSRGETALTPVMLMTSKTEEKHRVQGFKLGADDYLPKPFNVEELVLRVQRILHRAPLRPKSQSGAALHGSLSDIGLGPLLTLLEMEGKSGLLRLSRGSNKCILYLRDGNVIRTRRNTGGMRDAETVYDALCWTDGNFQFKAERVGGAVEIGQTTIQMLMEASRRMDEQLN